MTAWQDLKEVAESPHLLSFVLPGAKKQHPQAGGGIVEHDTPLKRGPVGGVYTPGAATAFEMYTHTHTHLHIPLACKARHVAAAL